MSGGVAERMRLDMYLAPHYRFFMREVRHVVYSQYLESYKSISLDNMAATFGVSREFIDSEIAGFIASGKLACKIDRVSGILETTRPDTKLSENPPSPFSCSSGLYRTRNKQFAS